MVNAPSGRRLRVLPVKLIDVFRSVMVVVATHAAESRWGWMGRDLKGVQSILCLRVALDRNSISPRRSTSGCSRGHKHLSGLPLQHSRRIRFLHSK